MRGTYDCPSQITVCTTIVDLNNGSSIDGDVVVLTNCGPGSNISCAAGCPIGTVCNLQTNACSLICNDDDDCMSGQSCVLSTSDPNLKICILDKDVPLEEDLGSWYFSTASIITIVLVSVLVIAMIILIVLAFLGILKI